MNAKQDVTLLLQKKNTSCSIARHPGHSCTNCDEAEALCIMDLTEEICEKDVDKEDSWVTCSDVKLRMYHKAIFTSPTAGWMIL